MDVQTQGRKGNTIFDVDETVGEAASDVFESAIHDSDDPNDNEDIRWLREQRLTHKSAVWYRRPTVSLITFSMLLFFSSGTVAIPAKVVLLLKAACNQLGNLEQTKETCHDPKVQEIISSIQSLSTFTIGLVSALISGKIGELSDRFGRKPVLIGLSLFTFLNKTCTLLIYNPNIPLHKSSYVILALLESLGGGTSVMLSVANSYVTDVVESHERIVSLGFVFGSLYTGLAIGPLIGSFLTREIGSDFAPLYFEVLLSVLFALIVIFVIQESRAEKLRRRSQSKHLQRKASFASQLSQQSNNSKVNTLFFWKLLDIISPLKSLWIPRHKTEGLRHRFNLLLLIFIDSVLMITTISLMPPLILYTTYNFEWSSETIGYFVSVIGFSKAFVLYLFTPTLLHLLRKVFKLNTTSVDYIDFTVISIGSFLELLSPVLIILTNSTPAIFLAACLSSLGAFATPTLQASIVKYVPEHKVGEVFGALTLVKNIMIMCGPPAFLSIYSKTVNFEPKTVFFLSALCYLIAMASSFLLLPHKEKSPQQQPLLVRSQIFRSFSGSAADIRRQSSGTV